MLANAAKSNAAPVLSQHGERPISCCGRRDEMSKKLDREAFSKFVRVDSQLAGALTRGSSSTDAGDLNKVRMIGGFHELDPSDRDRGVVDRRRSVVQQQLFDDGRTGETRPPAEAHRQQETWRAQGRPIRLASGKVAIGPARNHRLADQAARLCLSQRDPDRGRDLLDGHGGPRDADGVFTILEKEEEHYSKTYDNAPMPHMHRLTWDGIALHAGRLPGYPASHGCVRLPKAFAEKLYGITQLGTPVIIADEETHPASVYDPGLLLGAEAKNELSKVSKKKKPAFTKSNAVTSILVSSADKSIYVIQNGDIVVEGKAEIADPNKPLGSNVFILAKGNEDGFTWEATGYSTGKKAARKPNSAVVERITPPPDVQTAIDERMKPGMVFVTTDQPATPDTRSGKDFVVMDAEGN